MTRALFVVVVQNDFMPGGRLPVPGGNEIVPVINEIIPRYPTVAASLDWHPPGHASFIGTAESQSGNAFPPHCRQFSGGAMPADGLMASEIQEFFAKGTNPLLDQFSCLEEGENSQAFRWLRERSVRAVDLVGVALEYCVFETALNMANLGFEVRILLPAVRALVPGVQVEVALRADESRVKMVNELNEATFRRRGGQ